MFVTVKSPKTCIALQRPLIARTKKQSERERENETEREREREE
jgi:hypothetical protein